MSEQGQLATEEHADALRGGWCQATPTRLRGGHVVAPCRDGHDRAPLAGAGARRPGTGAPLNVDDEYCACQTSRTRTPLLGLAGLSATRQATSRQASIALAP